MRTIALLTLLALTACDPQPEVRWMPREQAVGLAREAAQEAFQALSAELAKSISEGGPVKAIPVCSDKAGPLLKQIAEKRGLGMIRLSDLPRNPDQEAKGADLEAITAFRDAMKRGESPAPAVEEMADGSSTVRIPIFVSSPLCLQCHGKEADIAPETRKATLASYPDDKATGYALNDLRGIWKITVPFQR